MKKLLRTMKAALVAGLILGGVCTTSIADSKNPPAPLTPAGEALQKKYASLLEKLSKEVIAEIPTVDAAKKDAFMKAREAYSKITIPGGKEPDPKQLKEAKAAQEAASIVMLEAARALIPEVDAFLASDTRDEKLMKIAILSDATPRGLAEFAQQGKDEEALVEKLFADNALMKQMLIAGGANGGEWGESMQVYTAILEKSERARDVGTIFQRLALGTALQQPLLKGKKSGGIYGIWHADANVPDGPVSRYLHYEKAYLDKELDPAFKDMNTWECRFITNDPYPQDDLAWVRKMLRAYRPDHILNPDYKWRYARMVKSDVPYCSPDWRPDEPTTKVQQIVAGGGKCGPRAFFGRTVCRAFGIPSRRSTQTGHAAMNHWTPDGWVVCFGAWWSMNWAGPWGGLDFLLESQAREHPEEFVKVCRAQWIGDAFKEKNVSIRYYGKGGGLWNSIAFCKKQVVVEDAKIKALELMGGMELGESDNLIGDEEGGPQITIPEEHRAVTTDDKGVITIPAAAARKIESTDRIKFMESYGGDGYQVHYGRLGKRPELISYRFTDLKAGDYKMTLKVATVGREQTALIRLNRRTFIDLKLPFTLGEWQDTEPVKITLQEGRNSFQFTCKAPNRGVSIKHFKLTPITQ